MLIDNFTHNLIYVCMYEKSMEMFKVAFSLFSNINQSACSTLDLVLNNQSDFD